MIYLVCILAYLFLLAGIGFYMSRRVAHQDDFVVAGRSLSPWMMVCTMLAVWIGTGSIVGNAEQTYETGMAALLLPVGTLLGMILLSLIAAKARRIEANSVPEIIGRRFGSVARALSVVALVMAYMVIVSYQYNAGGAVLEVITGDKPPVPLHIGSEVTRDQLSKGRLVFTPEREWTGVTEFRMAPALNVRLHVVASGEVADAQRALSGDPGAFVVKENSFSRIRLNRLALGSGVYTIQSMPGTGSLQLVEPILTAKSATLIAAVFIVAYTTLAGLLSLVYADIATGTIIIVSMLIAFPLYWLRGGGWTGMEASFAAMGDKPTHMQLWGVYSTTDLINFCLPVFLLVLGDANQYQRIFASRNARGARMAVTVMIFAAFAIELLIIASAWAAGSMTPDPENGRYILIYAARHYLPLPLGCLFMVTAVAIIVSTADSFLLVPATTIVNDVYLPHINPKAGDRAVILLNRVLIVVFGAIAYAVSRAFAESTGFFEKALYAFTIYGASITPTLVAALLWQGATRTGAVTSILAGTVVSLVWSEADFVRDALPPALAGLDAVLPAMAISVLCLVVVSLLTGRRSPTNSQA